MSPVTKPGVDEGVALRAVGADSLLARLEGPEGLKGLSGAELNQIAEQLRTAIIATTAVTGGHLGPSLGVVELTIALHHVMASPVDRIVFDTGHQAYPHKLLTGRLARFGSLRQLGGIGGFPRRTESPHDVFDGGHAGTGISIGQGLALARDVRGGSEKIAVVVGDAALMSGLSLEALNDIGHRQTKMLIVLNDNEMSISPTVGAISTYLSKVKLSKTWRGSKGGYDKFVGSLPLIGDKLLRLSRSLRRSVVSFAQEPGRLFEDLGITYVGVLDGHDRVQMEEAFNAAFAMPGPVIVHVRTQKGRGYRPAEADPITFHGAALPKMEVGVPTDSYGKSGGVPEAPAPKRPNYTALFAAEVIAAAADDRRIVAITAGMPTGTGLDKFAAAYPDRFYDVGIAEQHAVATATGIAMGGGRPVVAIYSTFLQRAWDQIVHDACQNDQPVLFGVDRAGLVGEDGTSHQGMFTLTAQRQIPRLVIASPKDEQELRALVRTALAQDHPFALHYPRDSIEGVPPRDPRPIPVGKAETLAEGSDIVILGFGPIVQRGLRVAEQLRSSGLSVGVVNAIWASPIDDALYRRLGRSSKMIVTLEESVTAGGFGGAVAESLAADQAATGEPISATLLSIGIPAGAFVDHGSVSALRTLIGLDEAGIERQIRAAWGARRAR
ncbi:MAG: 1-deoxy-D-xylulose-5-phosphate synthase [Chloroflexi bacterium]|nr:1-deoxy-D-xylulose-5-phosphate synthase [Chloroflexota bacterium]